MRITLRLVALVLLLLIALPLSGIAQSVVATGNQHTCVRQLDGVVKCWGFNLNGQLGDDRGSGFSTGRRETGRQSGDMGANLPASDLGSDFSAASVAAGGLATCAVAEDGRLKCWGDNVFGRLGLGDMDRRGDDAGEMGDALPYVDLGTGRTVKSVSMGSTHTCAILDNDDLKCWGWQGLGYGDNTPRGDGPGEMGDALAAVNLGAGRTAVQVSAGAQNTAALLDDGTVAYWEDDRPPFVLNLGTGRTATQVVQGERHGCALLDDATVKCWGKGVATGAGTISPDISPYSSSKMGDNLSPVNLGTGRTAVALTTATESVCAILDDASLKCWGRNNQGQLGLGDDDSRGDRAAHMGDDLPTVALGTGRTARKVFGGQFHFCALLDDGGLKCWGNDGAVGLEDSNDRGDEPGEMDDALPYVDYGGSIVVSSESAAVLDGYALDVPSVLRAGAVARLTVAEPQHVRLSLYDVLGRHVATLHSATVSGEAEVRLDASALPSGAYFLRAEGETFALTGQAFIVR